MEAHKSMDKIRLYTICFQQNVKHVVTILIRGSEHERISVLPGILESLMEDATKCMDLAKTTEDKFDFVIKLINETAESSAAVKGCYENDLIEAKERQKYLEKEQENIEAMKKDMDIEKKRIIEEVESAKTYFERSLDKVPGVGKLLAMNVVEETMKIATGAVDLFAQYKMMGVSKGVSFVNTFIKSVQSNQMSNKADALNIKTSMESGFKVAYQHATNINECLEIVYKMFEETEKSEKKQNMQIDLNHHKSVLLEIKGALLEIKEKYSKSEMAKNPTVLQATTICTNGIELCDEILKIKPDKCAYDLFRKVDKVRNTAKAFHIKARMYSNHSSVSIPNKANSVNNQHLQSKRVFELASENARYEVEIRRKELDNAKKTREKLQKELRDTDAKHNKILAELSKIQIEEIEFEEIQKTLKDGLKTLAKLKAQWTTLVSFFQNITNGIEICLTQNTSQLAKMLKDDTYSKEHITRSIVLEMAASVNSVAYSVELIAKMYTDISQKHLIQNIASLGELIAYDPVSEKDLLDARRIQIDEDCKRAKAEIQILAEKSRDEMDNWIEAMIERLNAQIEQLPKLPPERLQTIKENVENGDIDVADFV